jgi:hypothetical protein
MIDLYEFGHIVVKGQHFTQDIIIFPDHIQSEWWRKESHKLVLEDLDTVFDAKPLTLIIGTGNDGILKVEEEVKEYCKENKIKLIVKKTKRATQEYNALQSESNIIAALHLTC